MRLAVVHSPAVLDNFGGLLEYISMVAHSGSIGNLIFKSDKSYMLISNIIFYYLYHTVSVGNIN